MIDFETHPFSSPPNWGEFGTLSSCEEMMHEATYFQNFI